MLVYKYDEKSVKQIFLALSWSYQFVNNVTSGLRVNGDSYQWIYGTLDKRCIGGMALL